MAAAESARAVTTTASPAKATAAPTATKEVATGSSLALFGNQAIQTIYRSAIDEPPCECGETCPKCQTKAIMRDAADRGAGTPPPAIPNTVAATLASRRSSPLP